MLSVMMRRKNYNTAVLDADITGPSIPKLFGITEKAASDIAGIYPVLTKTGIEVMSVNLLLENETDPVVWRGPVIAGAVKQFWTDVIWGDVDFMFVDMASRNGRCAAYRFSVTAGGRNRNSDVAAGAGIDDCRKGSKNGTAYECACSRYC